MRGTATADKTAAVNGRSSRPRRNGDDQGPAIAGIWAALQVARPEGIDRASLELIAANTGLSVDALLREHQGAVAPLEAHREPADMKKLISSDLSANLELLSRPPHTESAGASPFREAFHSALHNLMANRTRGLLTMLGIIIGVFAVVVLQSVGNGLIGYVDSVTGDYGGNNVTIQPVRLVVNGIDTGALSRSLSVDDAKALADPNAVPDAIAVSPTTHARVLLHASDKNFSATAVGVWPDYLSVGGYTLTSGAFVTMGDVNNRDLVAVLGANSARNLFPDSDPIGQTVWLNGTALRVVGVLAARESLIAGGDDNVYLPLSTALDRVIGGQTSTSDASKSVDAIVLRARTSRTIDAVQRQSTEVLAARHQLGSDPPDFAVSSLLSALEQRAQILAAMKIFMVIVAGISLVVGGIGIMNIMLVSVAERTREIGLRKALGARGQDILNQFLVEAMLISLLGAGIGLAFAGLLVLLISVIWRPSPPSLLGTVIAVVAALATGLFFGVSPARRAAGLQPIEALRAE
jgi:putative ABC transport system permease protein